MAEPASQGGLVADAADQARAASMRSLAQAHASDLARFLRQPDRRPASGLRASRWWFVLAVDLLVTAMVDGLAFALPDDIQTLFWRVDIETNMLLLSALLIAPVVEELLFRAGLRNATYLAFFGPALVALFAGSPAVALAMWAAAMACLLVWRRQLARAGGRVKMARHFSRRYRLWFWVYAGAFALLHTSNFTPTTGQYLWLPLLVLPQFLMGAGFGYVRIRNGLAGAMALHFTHNLMAVGLYLVGVRY